MAHRGARSALHPDAGPCGRLRALLRRAAVEITFEDERYLVVPQTAILALVRGDRREA
ncbi:MAG TPA: hypothetical protein VMS45_00775 [Gemmatimonadaceae bacterium]|nr:hypothetical protein [Gemmatimonadaceae bacterium]